MSKLIERIMNAIRPVQSGSSSSTHVENSTTSVTPVGQTVNPIARSSTSTSVIPWSANQVGIVDEDDFAHVHSMLNQHAIARPAISSYPLGAIFPSNNYVFPSTVGLMHYYTQAEHLSHLANGMIQPSRVLSLESSPKMEVAVSLGKDLSVVKCVKPYGTPLYQENALSSMLSQVFLPPSFVKPVYLNQEQFIEICVGATLVDFLKIGAPLPDLVLLQNLLRGLPGKNISNLQYLAAHLSQLKSSVDFRSKISTNLLDTMSAEDLDKLSTVSLSRQASLIHEIVAKTIINQQQVSQLRFTGTIHNPRDPIFNSPGYYNNSGNACPDYVLELAQPVGEYTHMGVDFKFTRSNRGNHDIIKGCSDNLEMQLTKAHKDLHRLVSLAIKDKTITVEDQDIGKRLLNDLAENQSNYFADKNLDNYVSGYNSLGETFNDFLLRKKIGINRIAPISVDTMVVDPAIKEAFSTRFQHFYSSPESSLLEYLNKTGHNQNASLVDTRKIILSYADYILSNLS